MPDSAAPPLRVTAASRRYGERVALDGVDFELGAGEIGALVGPNGSGKTTLLKLVAGLLRPDSGEVRVLGLDPARERPRVMREARFAFAPPALFETLTAREHLEYLSAVGGRRADRLEVTLALETVGLDDRADERVVGFSFGMRQRLALAQALVPLPRLLVMDEPTEALDPLAILELRRVLRELRDGHGTAILLSSHLLVEVEELVDHVLVLSEGRELFRGAPRELLEGRERLLVEVDDVPRAVEALTRRGIVAATNGGGLALPADCFALEELQVFLGEQGVRVRSFHVERPTLERALLERMRVARASSGPRGAREADERPETGEPRR